MVKKKGTNPPTVHQEKKGNPKLDKNRRKKCRPFARVEKGKRGHVGRVAGNGQKRRTRDRTFLDKAEKKKKNQKAMGPDDLRRSFNHRGKKKKRPGSFAKTPKKKARRPPPPGKKGSRALAGEGKKKSDSIPGWGGGK